MSYTPSIQASNAVAITGGSINGTPIGTTTPSDATFTTLSLTNNQTANWVYAAPNGSVGTPRFRALVAADMPTATEGALGVAQGGAGITVTSGVFAITNPFVPTAVAITGGTIDGATIGGTTRAVGSFTFVAGSTNDAVAAAGTTTATATVLNAQFNNVSSGTGGVRPTSFAPVGTRFVVWNGTGSAVNFYPISGGKIGSGATDAPASIAAAGYGKFVLMTSTQMRQET